MTLYINLTRIKLFFFTFPPKWKFIFMIKLAKKIKQYKKRIIIILLFFICRGIIIIILFIRWKIWNYRCIIFFIFVLFEWIFEVMLFMFFWLFRFLYIIKWYTFGWFIFFHIAILATFIPIAVATHTNQSAISAIVFQKFNIEGQKVVSSLIKSFLKHSIIFEVANERKVWIFTIRPGCV